MKRILIFCAGGTVGSGSQSGALSPQSDVSAHLARRLRETFASLATFHLQQAFSVLSENATPAFWSELTEAVAAIPFAEYDGIILTHGTDTLSYTSALLGMLFDDCPIPLILTGSNLPPDDPQSAAFETLCACVRLILGENARGVLTVYRDNNGTFPVYDPLRLQEADPATDRFRPFGEYPAGIVTPQGFEGKLPEPGVEHLPRGAIRFRREVLALKTYPGLAFGRIDPAPYAAALVYLYHSGTACTAPGKFGLPSLADACAKRGIPLYVASCRNRKTPYAGEEEIQKSGARRLYDISFEAAYMKLCIAVNQTAMTAEEYMRRR